MYICNRRLIWLFLVLTLIVIISAFFIWASAADMSPPSNGGEMTVVGGKNINWTIGVGAFDHLMYTFL